MDQVSDEFLLAVAQTAATLLGLLLLGGFFYLETGLDRAGAVGRVAQGFLRATVKFTMVLYSLVLVVSLGMVVLTPGWLVAVFLLFGAVLVRALVEWTRRYRELRAVLPVPWESTWLSWAGTAGVLTLPWSGGSLVPGREATTWALLLAGALALQSTASLLLTSFDLAELERAAGTPQSGHAGRRA